MTRLPIDDTLPGLIGALRDAGRAVLEAPPGAGKTTRVPLAMLEAGLTEGRILMLEPRRLAARTAAARMADTLDEPPGRTVGFRIRGEARTSRATRIEVVTEGILTRMIQSDPELTGIGAVIFDEFHERSLHADLGLALCLEIAGALRDDLILLAMSATLDAAPLATLMQAPRITARGRAHPVERHYRPRPAPRFVDEGVAELIRQALSETPGDILAFLPGEGEIRRTMARLCGIDAALMPLYGALPFKEQQRALRPRTDGGRKVVLATAIAETSLTIEGITAVVDGGLARRARFDPGSGMSRLVTEKVSRAEATQRAGRAGRLGPGHAYANWTRGEEGALPAHPPAEIEAADLAPLALELALWGGDDLPFLTLPPAPALAEARALLTMLGALDAGHRITDHGRALARLPLHPRLAHMLTLSGPDAAPLAALLGERDPLPVAAPVDLTLRLEALADPRRFADTRAFAPNQPILARIRDETARLARLVSAPGSPVASPAAQAALAYPDRIGLRRKGEAPRFLLSGGKGAIMDAADPLAGQRLIVVTDTDGNPREARIRQAVAMSEAELREHFAPRITWQDSCQWSRREGRVIARRREMLGAIALDDRQWKDAPEEALARAMLDGIRELGLLPSDRAQLFRARVALARDVDPGLPDLSDPHLIDSLETWLLPHLTGVRTAAQWKAFDILPALRARFDWPATQALDRLAPAEFTTPLGRRIAIDYGGEHPEIRLRLQEMFGQTAHPAVAGRPLRVTLLSPAGRPVQTTMDLPGFWSSSYADVRRDMRGRYPKHPWPEDPTVADPTLRAKQRR